MIDTCTLLQRANRMFLWWKCFTIFHLYFICILCKLDISVPWNVYFPVLMSSQTVHYVFVSVIWGHELSFLFYRFLVTFCLQNFTFTDINNGYLWPWHVFNKVILWVKGQSPAWQTAATMSTLQDRLLTLEMLQMWSTPLFGEVQELLQCLLLVLTS